MGTPPLHPICMKSNKIDVVFGRGCRRIRRAMPLNLSARIFHSVIGNHYSHSLEISLYFEWFVKQMEPHQQSHTEYKVSQQKCNISWELNIGIELQVNHSSATSCISSFQSLLTQVHLPSITKHGQLNLFQLKETHDFQYSEVTCSDPRKGNSLCFTLPVLIPVVPAW